MADRVVKAIITGDASGAVRAFNETAAASETTGKRTAGSFAQVGAASRQHIGGTSVQNAGLLEGAFKKIDTAVGSVLGSIARVATTSVGIGGAAALGGFLVSSISNAEKLNVAVEGYSNAIAQSGQAFPVAQYAAEQQAMEKIGIGAVATTDALTQMTQAHIPLSEQMQTLQAAADLMAAKHLPDLVTALSLVEKAAQGQGRALTDLGIVLPATIPKANALASAQKALTTEQDNYTAALKRYGPNAQQTIDAHKRLADAQQKVTQTTDEMQSPFENLSQITQELEGRLGGAADAAANADPWERLKTEWETVTEKAGMLLLPKLDELAHWVEDHMPQIEQFMTSAFQHIGDAINVAGDIIGAVAGPAEGFIGFLGDHSEQVKLAAEAFGAFYVANKGISIVKGLSNDVGEFLGLIHKIPGVGSTSLPGIGAGMPVTVTNWPPGFGAGTGVGGGPEPVPTGAPAPGIGTPSWLSAVTRIAPSIAGDLGGAGVILGSVGLSGAPVGGGSGPTYAQQQAQEDLAKNTQQAAHVSADVANLWSELKTNTSSEVNTLRTQFYEWTNTQGNTNNLSHAVADLWSGHEITTAGQLQTIKNLWNEMIAESGGVPPTVAQIKANYLVHQDAAQLAAAHGQAFSDAIASLAQQAGVSADTIIGDYVTTSAFAASMAGLQQDINNRLANLADNIPSSVYDSTTGGGSGFLKGVGGATGGKYPGLAGGGKVFGPGLHWVGEGLHNPEWVINNEQAGRFAPLLDALVFGGAPDDIGSPPALTPLPSSSGGGAVINNYVTIQVQGGDPNAVVAALKRYQAANGTIPVTVSASRRVGAA